MGAYGYRGTILNSVRGDTLTSEYQKNEHFRNWKCSFFDMFRLLYSMKIKEQTRKLAASCSKHCFEVVDKTDEVSNHIYGKATLTWFEEIFEEY